MYMYKRGVEEVGIDIEVGGEKLVGMDVVG